MITKILVATDGSDGALKAAEKAASLAKGCSASVTLLNVFSVPVYPMHASATSVSVNVAILESARPIQDAATQSTGKVFEAAGQEYSVRNEIGGAVEVIARVAEEGAYDLIVLGSSGLGELGALFLGSVSHGVAQRAHCPVLIVR